MIKYKYRKVMVVDDTAVDRYIADRNIKKYGLAEEVICKESAKSGLEYLRTLSDNPLQLPQLIFLDIRMPEMDGFDFLDAFEKLPEIIKSTCIIKMLSTSLNPNDHEKVNNSKYVEQFINKPLDKEKISGLLKEEKHLC